MTKYDGQGLVRFEAGKLLLQPRAAASPEQTHAALVLYKSPPQEYFDLEIHYRNRRQLRVKDPHPWEVFWLFFNYQEDSHGKRTNYLIVKSNGLEIGRATGEKDQKILKTWASPSISGDQLQAVRLSRWGTRLVISVNQSPPVLYDFALDAEQPFDQKGSIGLYCEDAEVEVYSLQVKRQ